MQPKRKLTLADLAPTVTDSKLRKSLKLLAEDDVKSSSKHGIARKLDVPLPKREQNRIDRAAAGVKSKETLDQWIDTVKHNRRAEHLSFPLQNPNTGAAPGSKRLLTHESSNSVTELEQTIQNILQENGLAPANGKSGEERIQELEEQGASRLPLAEVQARRADLRRARELLFREEIRAKRIKKIKSKSFRKVHRKEREHNAQLESNALAEAGVEVSKDENERNDRRRAEERMGARHRESKWAKSVKGSGRAIWDDDARGGVTDMARRGEELRKRMEGRELGGSDDDTSNDDDEDDDTDDEKIDVNETELKKLTKLRQNSGDSGQVDAGAGGLAAMDFMKKAEAIRKARNDDDLERLRRDLAGEGSPSEDEAEAGAGRKRYGASTKSTNRISTNPFSTAEKSEFEERNGSDGEENPAFPDFEDEAEIITNTIQKPIKGPNKLDSFNSHQPDKKALDTPPSNDLASNPWLKPAQSSTKTSKRQIEDTRAGAIITNTLPPQAKPASTDHSNANPRSTTKSAAHNPEALQTNSQTPNALHNDNDNDKNNDDDDETSSSTSLNLPIKPPLPLPKRQSNPPCLRRRRRLRPLRRRKSRRRPRTTGTS